MPGQWLPSPHENIHTFEELTAMVGQEVAVSDWVTITQTQVDSFAAATGDTQWIHVDVERAKAGPFGGTIAQGFLTLALIPRFLETALALSRMACRSHANGCSSAKACSNRCVAESLVRLNH
jgi:acyl dehydratase